MLPQVAQFDTTGGNTLTWAVLNHNSDLAIIPEPATWALLIIGGVGLLIAQRRATHRPQS